MGLGQDKKYVPIIRPQTTINVYSSKKYIVKKIKNKKMTLLPLIFLTLGPKQLALGRSPTLPSTRVSPGAMQHDFGRFFLTLYGLTLAVISSLYRKQSTRGATTYAML